MNVDTVNSKTIHCTTVSGTNEVRSLHTAQASAAPIYSKRIATQANRVSDVMRAAKKPRLNKNFTEDVVRLHAELSDVRRAAYHAPNVQKDCTDSIVALHDEVAPIRRAANRSAPTVSKNFSAAIAALASRPVVTDFKPLAGLIPDFRLSFRRVANQIAALQRQLSRPAVAKTWSRQVGYGPP